MENEITECTEEKNPSTLNENSAGQDLSGQNGSAENSTESVIFPKPEKQPNTIEIVTKSTVFSYFLNAMIIFGVCFVSCWFVFYVLFTQVEVIGLSMLPTINASAYNEKDEEHVDMVYIIGASEYKYKDIVVIEAGKTVSNSRLIKRVIATPGQTISFRKTSISPANGKIYYDIYLNGVRLEEDYIYEQQLFLYIDIVYHYDFYETLINELDTHNGGDGHFSITMGKDEYFVMGDNRNNSTDSRFFGPIKKKEIIGKTVLQVKYGDTLFNTIWKAIFGSNLCY